MYFICGVRIWLCVVRAQNSETLKKYSSLLKNRTQYGYVERVIGLIRRECLNHIVVTGEQQLHRIMQSYVDYYNRARTHLALRMDAPSGRRVERRRAIRSVPVLGGLHHRYAQI